MTFARLAPASTRVLRIESPIPPTLGIVDQPDLVAVLQPHSSGTRLIGAHPVPSVAFELVALLRTALALPDEVHQIAVVPDYVVLDGVAVDAE